MAADVSSFIYFGPILAFLIVFAIMVALLYKTRLFGENFYIQIFFSFFVAAIFITASSARQLVLNVVPWFAVLLIALFLIMIMITFIGKQEVMIGKGFGWIFVIVLIIIFLVAGIKVFSNSMAPYLPNATSEQAASGDPTLLGLFSWLYSPRVRGFFMVVIAAIIVTWVLMKAKK